MIEKPDEYMQMEVRVGVDVAWRIDKTGKMVVDRMNIPLTEELKEHICPSWVRELLISKTTR